VDCISVITKYLNLKEKAMVCQVNKAWLEGATAAVAVEVNSELYWANLDDVLKFVGSRFSNLKDFTLNIDHRFFFGENGKPVVELDGASLSNLFSKISSLRSVKLSFDHSTDEPVHRIIEQELGLNSLHIHSALESLTLAHACFDNKHSLCKAIEPFKNLRMLNLVYLYDYENRILMTLSLEPMARIKHLRALSLSSDGLFDSDIRSLIPILENLRSLTVTHNIFDRLSDASLKVIANNCSQLQSLDVSYNTNYTIKGILKTVSACPLRKLLAYATCVTSFYLQQILQLSSTLCWVRFKADSFDAMSRQNQTHLREATEASGGRIIFENLCSNF